MLQKVGTPGAPTEEQKRVAAVARGSGIAPETVKYPGDAITPEHYKFGGIETIDFLKAKLTPDEFAGLCKGNIIKYITRANHKNGLEDIKKARQYCDYLIAAMEEQA